MGSFHDRCPRHPQRRLVGICGYCLHERLTLLMESVSPDEDYTVDSDDSIGDTHRRQLSGEVPLPRPPLGVLSGPSHERSVSIDGFPSKSSAAKISINCAKSEHSLRLPIRKAKSTHEQRNSGAHPLYHGLMKQGLSAYPLDQKGRTTRDATMPVSCRRSSVSESDTISFPDSLSIDKKKKGSWFSLSKGKRSLLSSAYLNNIGAHEILDGHILAGRKSASDAIGRSSINYRQAYMGNLESIAEINIGDAAGKAESNELNGDGQANLSWISSLFHRKWRSKNKTFSGHGNSNTNSPFTHSEAGSALNDVGGTNLLQLPPLEPGRLSWDGPKSNFKHILKRIEARKKHQRVDCSPLHAPSALEDARQECFCDDPEMGQLSSLQKSKSVTSSRDVVSFEMPKSSRPPLATISSKQCVNDNLLEVCDNTHVTDKESRRWGRAWNKSLSPLMGFKHHGPKGVRGSRHLHSGFATPRHVVNFNKSSTVASSFSSPHISSLPNHENFLDVHLRLAQ